MTLDAIAATAEIAGWEIDRPIRIVVILVGAVIVSRLGKRGVDRLLATVGGGAVQRRLESAAALAPAALRESTQAAERSGQRIDALGSVLRSCVAVVVYAIALLLILSEFGISLAPLLAGAGIVGLAVGFGAQSLVKDFFTGVFILLEDQFAVGDIVDLGEATGVVENVSLRTTRLRSVDGVVWHIPNGEILRVGNMSQHWSRSLLDIEVTYDTDLTRAKRVIAEVAADYASSDPDVIEEPEVWGVEALGATGIVIRLVVKTRPSEQWRIARELRERVKEAFDREGIEFPFAQQTVWTRPAGAPGAEEPPPVDG
jgi:small-conductance mechanosensitive channel